MIAVEDGRGNLNFYVSPNLRSIVHETDLQYILDLFADLPDRARLDSEALFRQLSSLSSGVLVAREVGAVSPEDAGLAAIPPGFIPL
jgi:hypothetical protein